MPLTTCPRCKKIFDKMNASVCPKCQEAENEDYDRIRSVLDAKPNLNAEQVAAEAEVDIQVVTRMLDDGLIANISLSDEVKCGRCGAPAISRSKKLCQACLEKLNVEVARAQAGVKLSERKKVQVGEFLHARKAFDQKRRG